MTRIDRRQLLRLGAAATGAAVLGPRLGSARATDPPNIVLILTDQSRIPQHWPDGWAQAHLTADQRLAASGITFRRFFCNASMCSPSRASLYTGLYPAEHRVERTLTYNGAVSHLETPLDPALPNLASILGAAGYDVVLKGKWHLSKHADGGPPDAADVAAFGFTGWDPTTAGEGAAPDDFGGGCAAWDAAIVDDAVGFLAGRSPSDPPFALVVSLANPHDVLSYPRTWDQVEPGGCDNYASTANFDLGIQLPPSFFSDDLSTKPTCQAQSLQLYAAGLGALATHQQRLDYVNFYAWLQTIVDAEINRLLDALVPWQGSTVVIRSSDHGEMGLAHGGLRQKMFNAYEETMHLPLIVSHPGLFPSPLVTDALASTVDLLPTVLSLASLDPSGWQLRGHDLSPVLADPAASVQDTILFTFDDEQAGTANGQPTVTQPNHLRAIRTDDAEGTFKLARSFDPSGVEPEQLEMYHLADASGSPVDPDEVDNLAHPSSPGYDAYAATRDRLRALLAATERDRLELFSDGFESGATGRWNQSVP